MLNLTPRDYQKAILQTAIEKNTLVVLPTGLGKTLIALMLSVEKLKQHPTKKVLMLAPTRPLVEQHFNYFKKNLPDLFAEMHLFTGSINAEKRKSLWDSAEIVFSTPQCVANDLENYLYDLKDVVLLIIDEAHRCLKNYDYTKVASFYKQQSNYPHTLGLTASPGSDKEKIKQICKHLNIESLEVRNRNSPDVKSYLQDLEFNKIEVPFPAEFMEVRILLKSLLNSKIDQLRNRSLLFSQANKIVLLQLQTRLASQIGSGNMNAMIGLSLTAQAIKISHALELLETQTLSGLREYLENLKKQADQKKSKGVQTLVNSPEFKAAFLSVSQLIEKKIEHPKIEELKTIVESQFKESKKSKIIVFSQFRETASTISKVLSQIPEVKSSVFLGQAKKTNSSGTSGLNQKEQKEIIEKFRSGEINVLCATSIGEEGLDIPEVSAVYFYEPIPSAIRKIQRTGRTARLAPGKLFILITKDTRDVAHHYASSANERKMYKTISDVKEEMKNKEKTLLDYK